MAVDAALKAAIPRTTAVITAQSFRVLIERTPPLSLQRISLQAFGNIAQLGLYAIKQIAFFLKIEIIT